MNVRHIISASICFWLTSSTALVAGFDKNLLEEKNNALAVYYYGYELYKKKYSCKKQIQSLTKEVNDEESKYKEKLTLLNNQKEKFEQTENLFSSTYMEIEDNLQTILNKYKESVNKSWHNIQEKKERINLLTKKVTEIDKEKQQLENTVAGKHVLELMKNGLLAHYKDLNAQRESKNIVLLELQKRVQYEIKNKELMEAILDFEEKNSTLIQNHFKVGENDETNEWKAPSLGDEKSEKKELTENKKEEQNSSGYCIIA